MENEIKRISKLYHTGKLFEYLDEAYAEGYWELAGDIAGMLVNRNQKIANLSPDQLCEQLQSGFYEVFQKILVKGELYE